jgi:dihydroorotase
MNEGDLSLRLGLKGMPAVAEEAMIARDIEIARSVKGKIHICHVSTARGVELIRRAKNDGVLITCEVTPHHLVLTEEAVLNYDTNAKMSPPLRKLEDCEALLAGLSDGTIDAIASDHAPHHLDNKQIEFSKASFGILGLQTNMPITFDLVARGKLSRQQAVAALSTMPAKSFKLEGGSLARGKVADITLIDPKRRWSFNQEINRSLSLNSPFFGREYSAQVLGVIISGSVKYDLDRRYALFSDKKGEDAGAA